MIRTLSKEGITFFLPAYNEEENLKVLIPEVDDILKKTTKTYEILVVNYEGSKDNTVELVKSLAKKYPVRLVTQPLADKGIGEAIRLGFTAACYPHIFYTDSDNQFEVREINHFLPLLGMYDVIAGYRKKRRDPLVRLLISKVYNWLVRIVFWLPYRDVDCAFRYVHKRVIDALTLHCKTGVATTELLVKTRKAGFKICQIPVTHKPRLYGVPVFVSGTNLPRFKVVKELLHEISLLRKDLKN